MKKIIATLQLFVVLFLFTACGTTYKKYSPPDATKLKASATKLNQSIKKSQTTAKKAKEKHVVAQQTTNTIKEEQINLDQKIDVLMKNAPAELQPFVKELQDLSKTQNTRIELLEGQLREGFKLHEELERDNAAVTSAENDVKRDGTEYLNKAQKLADDATMEREYRRKAESENLKMKILKWLGGGAIILFVITGIGVFILWKMGKFAVKL